MFLCETINSTCAEVTSIEETKGRIYFCNLAFDDVLQIGLVCIIYLCYNKSVISLRFKLLKFYKKQKIE